MKRVLLTLLMAVAIGHASGQSFVTIDNDPVSSAMGGTGAALAASGFSIYNNIASISLSDYKAMASYSYSPYMRNFVRGNNLHSAAGFYNLNRRHSLAVGIRYFQKAKVELFDDDPVAGTIANPKDMSVDVGYSFRINGSMGIGVTVRYMHMDMDVKNVKNGTAFGFDLGYYFHKEKLRAGVVLSNVGNKVNFGQGEYDTPGWIKGGVAYDLLSMGKSTLMGAVQLDYNFQPSSEKGFSSGLGFEYSYDRMLHLRGGYRLADDLMGYNYWTTGLGASVWVVDINLTYIIARPNDPINSTLRVSLGAKF